MKASDLLPFTGLIILHNLLHWFTPILIYRSRASLIYLLGQSILVFIIILFLKDATAILRLYSILIGESGSVIRTKWQRFAGGLFPLTLMIASILFFSGFQSIRSLLWPFLLIVGITLPYVISFDQQDTARQQAQSLLDEWKQPTKNWRIRLCKLKKRFRQRHLVRHYLHRIS